MPATTDPANLAAVFKAYDVRGTVLDQVDEDLARAGHRIRSLAEHETARVAEAPKLDHTHAR